MLSAGEDRTKSGSLESHACGTDDEPHGFLVELKLVGVDDGIELCSIVAAAGQRDLDKFAGLVRDDSLRVQPLPNRIDNGESVGEAWGEFVGDETAPISLRQLGTILQAPAKE